MHIRHAGIRADAAHVFGVKRRAVHLQATERIGPVEHDDLHAILEARVHRVAQDHIERVGTHADVLQVDDERIEPLQLLRGGLAVLAVERIDRQPGAGVEAVVEIHPGGDRAVDAVLGREEGDQLGLRRAEQDVERALAPAVHAGGVGEQADFLAGHGGKIVRLEHIDAQHDPREFLGWCRGQGGGRCGGLRRGLGRLARAAQRQGKSADDQSSEGNLHERPVGHVPRFLKTPAGLGEENRGSGKITGCGSRPPPAIPPSAATPRPALGREV